MKYIILLIFFPVFCFALEVTESCDIESGTTVYEDLNIWIDATVNLHGVYNADDIKCYGNSKLKIKPDDVETIVVDGIGLYSDKTSTIEDGHIYGSIFVGDGIVPHILELLGGVVYGRLWVDNNSSIEITGSGFNYEYGEIRQTIEWWDADSGTTKYYEINRTGTLTGTLENGDPLNVEFRILGNSNIILEEN